MDTQVDVAIVGAGTAGLNAMAQVRRAGRSFVLIDGGPLGTTCARVGCMPSKALLQVAEDFARRKLFDRLGIEGGSGLELDTARALEHVRDLRDIFVDRVLEGSVDELGEQFIAEHARFESPTVLRAGARRIEARSVVIATGSRPLVPAEWARFGERLITSDSLFELEALPASLGVIGLGVVGLEVGQALARLGVSVTGVDALGTIGGLHDPVVNAVAIELMGREFPLWLGASARIEAGDGCLVLAAGERRAQVEKVLVSIGRTPNLEHLGLDRLGLDIGALPIDPATTQLGDLPVFIAGDVTGARALLHEAADEGRIAGYNAARGRATAFRRRAALAITFTDPAICTVGAAWDALDEASVAVGEMRLGSLGRALIMGKNRGVVRVYAERAGGRILGGSLLAPKGEGLAHLLAWAVQQRLGVTDLLRMPYYHPVIEEALQAALYDVLPKLDPPPPGGLLELAEA